MERYVGIGGKMQLYPIMAQSKELQWEYQCWSVTVTSIAYFLQGLANVNG